MVLLFITDPLITVQKKELLQEQTRHWRKEEGEKVAMFLGQKSLLTTSTTEGTLATNSYSKF